MKYTLKSVSALAAALITFGSLAGGANAAVIVSVSDNGSDLLFEWSGSLELGGLPSSGTLSGTTYNWMTPSLPRMHGLSGAIEYYDFQSLTLTSFGTGTDLLSNGSSSGDSFGITIPSGTPGDTPGRVYVPSGYTNQTLEGTLMFTGETMSSQGIDLSTPVVFDFGLAVGTVTIQAAVIPEPSSAFLIGLGALGFVMRRSRLS